ncbi:hypothetical protein BDA96_02G168900 [Sorghum bicolor]|uniref:Uncharacterized protein n=1 Tax=Sorghum bicolor TaxID=4558 RepID=A0A921UVN2_SORBI|nr:hypothetical protein BDA96_02G168900 [Sorghum bicolor]
MSHLSLVPVGDLSVPARGDDGLGVVGLGQRRHVEVTAPAPKVDARRLRPRRLRVSHTDVAAPTAEGGLLRSWSQRSMVVHGGRGPVRSCRRCRSISVEPSARLPNVAKRDLHLSWNGFFLKQW